MITTLTAPACRAVSLEEARQQLRLDGDDEDLLLAAKLDAAQAELELMTGLRLCPQTLSLELEAWEEEVVVPVRPCAVTQVQYVGLSGAVVTMAASGTSTVVMPELPTENGISSPRLEFITCPATFGSPRIWIFSEPGAKFSSKASQNSVPEASVAKS